MSVNSRLRALGNRFPASVSARSSLDAVSWSEVSAQTWMSVVSQSVGELGVEGESKPVQIR